MHASNTSHSAYSKGGFRNSDSGSGLGVSGAGIVCTRNGGSERNSGTNCKAHRVPAV